MGIKPNDYSHKQWTAGDGRVYELRHDGKRRLTIRLSMYDLNNSCHYYARVTSNRPSIYRVDDGTWFCAGGYGADAPENYSHDFDARRKLVRVEHDLDGNVVGRVGDYTYRFNDARKALQACIDVTLKEFEDDNEKWVIRFEDCSEQLCCKDFCLDDLRDKNFLTNIELYDEYNHVKPRFRI